MPDNVMGAVLLGFAYFVVLMVVALEPHDPERRGRHRRGRVEGAR